MAVINQFDKRSGITYVYESISYWDQKQQPRAKRKLIGKRDPQIGDVVSTDGRGKKRYANLENIQATKPGPVYLIQWHEGFMGQPIFLMKSARSLE